MMRLPIRNPSLDCSSLLLQSTRYKANRIGLNRNSPFQPCLYFHQLKKIRFAITYIYHTAVPTSWNIPGEGLVEGRSSENLLRSRMSRNCHQSTGPVLSAFRYHLKTSLTTNRQPYYHYTAPDPTPGAPAVALSLVLLLHTKIQ